MFDIHAESMAVPVVAVGPVDMDVLDFMMGVLMAVRPHDFSRM